MVTDRLQPKSFDPGLPLTGVLALHVVADLREVAPDDLPPGGYTLAVGTYHPGTLEGLPVNDADGQPVAGDVIPLKWLSWP